MKFAIIFVCFAQITQIFLQTDLEDRVGKFWTIGLVRFANSVCNSSSNLMGTCYRRRECTISLNGTQDGRCASNLGVCCVIRRTCGDTSPYNNTYFVNRNYPNVVTGGLRCTMTIQRCDETICQVRIDFLSLTLAQPDGDGNCIYDAMTITGGGSQVPIICGENTGDHVYVEFQGNTDIVITISTTDTISLSRIWNLKVTQIACACPTRAPSGCLKFYTAQTGTVRSFNYGVTENTQLNTRGQTGTREMVNQNYGICVAMIPGYCSIEWSKSQTNSFTVSGDVIANPSTSEVGANCVTDFIIVPHPFTDGTALNYDRFCGTDFPTVTSFSKPFVLYVVNDADEVQDTGNRGFQLNYRQRRCSTLTL